MIQSSLSYRSMLGLVVFNVKWIICHVLYCHSFTCTSTMKWPNSSSTQTSIGGEAGLCAPSLLIQQIFSTQTEDFTNINFSDEVQCTFSKQLSKVWYKQHIKSVCPLAPSRKSDPSSDQSPHSTRDKLHS